MTDRTPGAPGQYKAVINEDQLAAMQSGKEFVITLVRDDQPVVEGTPYSKDAVLPDYLATALCPDIEDPTPAQALAALKSLADNLETSKITGFNVTAQNLDYGYADGSLTKVYIGGGPVVSADGHSEGILSFNFHWFRLQFKVDGGSTLLCRAKYGDNAWSGWSRLI